MTIDEALDQASEENGLATYYRSLVRPILRDGRVPRCCGSSCEPCAEQLTRVATRTLELLGQPIPWKVG